MVPMRKLLLLATLLFIPSIAHAADRYVVTTGTGGACTGNFGSTTCWSASDGGDNGASVPTSSDNCIFNTNSSNQNITLNANRNCLTLNMSNYTGTLAFSNNTLTVAGSVTLSSGMSITGTGALILSASGTLTSHSVVIPALTVSAGSVTITLGDDATVTGTCTTTSTGSVTFTANTLSCGGGLNFAITTGVISGTTTIKLTGTGTISMASVGSGSLRNNLTIDASGFTITMCSANGTVRYQTGTLTYTAGTIVVTGCTWEFTAASTVSVATSVTLFNVLSITGGIQTWSGASGFTCATLSALVAGSAHTMAAGNTYTVTSTLLLTATNAAHVSFTGSGGIANLAFTGDTSALVYANFTDVIASSSALRTYSPTNPLSGTTTGITWVTTLPNSAGGNSIFGQ